MKGSPAAGDLLTTGTKIIGGVGKFFGNLFRSKAGKAAAAAAKKLASSKVGQTALGVGSALAINQILDSAPSMPGQPGGGAGGGWTGRRRAKGITARELRGFRKVARLLHKEGMVIKHHRRAK